MRYAEIIESHHNRLPLRENAETVDKLVQQTMKVFTKDRGGCDYWITTEGDLSFIPDEGQHADAAYCEFGGGDEEFLGIHNDDEEEKDVDWNGEAFNHGWIRILLAAPRKEFNIEFIPGKPSPRAKAVCIALLKALEDVVQRYVVEYYEADRPHNTAHQVANAREAMRAIH